MAAFWEMQQMEGMRILNALLTFARCAARSTKIFRRWSH